jgi:hypothetical protein
MFASPAELDKQNLGLRYQLKAAWKRPPFALSSSLSNGEIVFLSPPTGTGYPHVFLNYLLEYN